MKVTYLTIIFLIISHFTTQTHQEFTPSRRILHQPLFPVTSEPPPATEPPPKNLNSDQPFFPEVPATADLTQPPPPFTAAPANENVSIPTATEPSKHAKTLAIVVSVGVVTFGMLSAFAFFLYRHRVKLQQQQHSGEAVSKFDRERNNNDNHNSNVSLINESHIPPSGILYIGTVEPSQVSESGSDDDNESPCSRLNSSVKMSDRYRPSPELQPLPPLSKAVPVENMATSSDEESYDATFYTPQGSSVGPEDGIYTPVSRQNSVLAGKCESSVPHSKRTSPKSRILGSSPDVKNVIIPTIKHAPMQPFPPPLPQNRMASMYPPARPKFSAPPPPPDLARLRSISNSSAPPPPPPPPPRPSALSTPNKVGGDGTNGLSKQQNLTPIWPQLESLSPKVASKSPNSSKSGSGSAGSFEMVGVDDGDSGRPKLKPLHWDKVRASSDRATVWDQLNAGSFQLNEDRIESLFCCNSKNSVPKGLMRKSVFPPVEKENRVLDPKKSQNIAILLRALNVTRDEVLEALLDGHPESLGAELLETLVKMAPTKEEEIKLRNFNGDISKLGSAERFLKAVLDVPFAFRRVEAMLYRANFDGEVKYLRKSFEILEEASHELKDSRLFLKLLEAVLRTGNRMNVGTNRGDAKAFKLDTLLKLVDVKGTDGKTTLLHFVVQEIIRSQGASNVLTDDNKMHSKPRDDDFRKEGLQVVAGLSRDLCNVKKAACMDSDVLSNYVSKLEKGLEIVRLVLQYETPDLRGTFFNSMRTFLKEAEEEITRIKTSEGRALSIVTEVTEYFHGDAGKEEAHPLRIFMVVRDFLSILDNVCKDVGMLQDHSMVGSAPSFRISAAASLPVLNRYNVRQYISSDEESSSP